MSLAERPNIVLITTDQQRWDTIHALGNEHIYTPHLDWLCDEGIAFTRAYSDSPVCVPARATIMTGKHGHTTGCVSNHAHFRPLAEHDTLPGILTANGYQTRAQGKMHFMPMRVNYGFEHVELPEDFIREGRRYDRAVGYASTIGLNEVTPHPRDVPEREDRVRWTVDRSIDFLDTHDPSRPFFLWTSFVEPHPPFAPPQNLWELYRDRPVPQAIRGDWSATPEAIPPGYLQPTIALSDYTRMSEQQTADSRRAYYSVITQIDYALGLLFGHMKKLGLLDNTWIIFTSDHGEMLGDHFMGSKITSFEGSAHIPMLVRPPAPLESARELLGTRCDRIVTLADILPTCLSLAGVEVPDDVDGQDLLSVAEHGGKDRTIVCDCLHQFFAVLDGSLKYTWTSLGGGELLFDLLNDPGEQRNLVNSSIHARDAERLRSLLIRHLERKGSEFVKDGSLHRGPPPIPRLVERYPVFPHSRTGALDPFEG